MLRPAPTRDDSRSARSVTAIAFSFALTAGILDVAAALLDRPSGFASGLALCPPIVAVGSLSLALFAISWLAVLRPVAVRMRLDRARAAAALAIGLLFLFALGSLLELWRSSLSPAELFELTALVALSATAALAGYRALGPVAPGDLGTWSLALAFSLLPVLVFEWGHLYRIESVLSLASAAFSFLTLVAFGLTFLAFARYRERAAAFLGALAILVPLAGAVSASKLLRHADREVAAGPRPKPIILVTADALRADALSCYSGETIETPRIDALAREGVLFEHPTSSAPWTLASLASILSGVSPTVHGLTGIKSRLPRAIPTLAEALSRASYRTGAVVLNDHLHPDSNMGQGFDDYVFLTEPSYAGSLGASLLQEILPGRFPKAPWPSSEDITRFALEWIERNRGQDFFLWVHYYDPHAPYTPPRRFLPDVSPPPGAGFTFYDQRGVTSGFTIPTREERQWIETLYKAEVLYLDESVGALVDGLKRLSLYDDALIVFTSDHGEEFWEHGAHGHGHSLHQEVLAVPLIVKLPGGEPRGRVSADVATESVTPTILELSGAPFEAERFTSPSLLSLMKGSADSRPAPVFSTAQVLFDRKESIVFDRMKYVRSLVGDEEELFDLATDPLERRSLLGSRAETVDEARALLHRHRTLSNRLQDHYRIESGEERVIDEERLERLRALGYVK